MSARERWMLYPVRSEQIKKSIEATGTADHDRAEVVIRVDGPLPSHPIRVVPADKLLDAEHALDVADLLADAIFEGVTQRTLESLARQYRAARQSAEEPKA
jgi:hypothetical protein